MAELPVRGVVVCLFAVGCAGDYFVPLPPEPPDIEVQPAQLHFSATELYQPVPRTLSIRNRGETELAFDWISVTADSDDGFTWALVEPGEPGEELPRLGAGQSFELEVVFVPVDRQPRTGTLAIASNDPDEHQVDVPLGSTSIAGAVLECVPNPVSLVAVPPGPIHQLVMCTNNGTAVLSVTDVVPAGSDMFDVRWPATPFDVSSGAPFEIYVTYAPLQLGTDAGTVTLISNAIDGDYVVDLDGRAVEEDVCALVPLPPLVQFGDVYVDTAADEVVILRNQGNAPCTVTGTGSITQSGEFDYVGTLPFVVPPSSSVPVTLRYQPRGVAPSYDVVSFGSDSETNVAVVVRGSGVAGVLHASPCPIDFGVVRTGCAPGNRQLALRNMGNASLTISAFDVSGGPFVSLSAPPGSVPPDGRVDVTIQLPSTVAGVYTGSVTIESNDPDRSITVCELRGEVSDDGHVVETFDTSVPEVDLLLVVDDSGSMDDQAQSLANSIQALLGDLETANVSYHLGLTTTDVSSEENPFVAGKRGRLLGDPKVIDNDTPNPRDALRQNLQLADNGDSVECGLEASRLALSEPLLSGENAGFLRPSADLFVIFMSDEEDQSPDGNDLWPVEDYAQALSDAKGNDPNRLQAAAIVVLEGDDCGPEVGSRYLELVDIVGGVQSTLCTDDFSPALVEMGASITDPPESVYLSSPVVPGTLQVYYDGALQSAAAWTHDPGPNRVSFNDGYVPPNGTVIRVEYDTVCAST